MKYRIKRQPQNDFRMPFLCREINKSVVITYGLLFCVFDNERYAANTSKKLRAVIETNAKAGKYKTTFAAYGYDKGADENKTPVIDPETAPIVRRIFEMRALGANLRKIAMALNDDGILSPADYHYTKAGKATPLP